MICRDGISFFNICTHLWVLRFPVTIHTLPHLAVAACTNLYKIKQEAASKDNALLQTSTKDERGFLPGVYTYSVT